MRRALIIALLLALAGAGSGIVLAATAPHEATASAGPPQPVITTGPTDPTTDAWARFHSTDTQKGVTFVCSLDGSPYTPCAAGMTYKQLTLGPHDFEVEAVDATDQTSDPTSWHWTVVPQVGSPFTITGAARHPLYPGGPSVAVELTFTNPNDVPITIGSVVMSIAGTSVTGCKSSDFAVTAQLSTKPVVPAGATASLSSLGVPLGRWPRLSMLDTDKRQPCKRATVNLSFSGTAN